MITSFEKAAADLARELTKKGDFEEAKLALKESVRFQGLKNGSVDPGNKAGQTKSSEEENMIVGTWIKKGTGSKVQILVDGSVAIPNAKNRKYSSGKWTFESDTLIFTFGKEKIQFNVVEKDRIESEDPRYPWKLNRNLP